MRRCATRWGTRAPRREASIRESAPLLFASSSGSTFNGWSDLNPGQSESTKAKAKKVSKGGVDTTLSRGAIESIARSGSRLARIQQLRDELIGLCRAYVNGAVSRSAYALRLSGLDNYKLLTRPPTRTRPRDLVDRDGHVPS